MNTVVFINRLKIFDYDADTVQSFFGDIDNNRECINGYAARYMLIHLRNAEKEWCRNLSEIVPETYVYACELAQKYIDRELFVHKPGKTKKGQVPDVFITFQHYMQVMKFRIGKILERYCKKNPASLLCYQRFEFTEQQLDGDIFDYVVENLGEEK
ncbi:MAG: hypothetical protein HUK20_04610 [Fibrobacter sp.]|nr:hypothetical protein [Fibrobacter sp.]